MFDLLLKSKFYTKCKTAIKMTRSRIEIIRKKRNAMQKYLRNDIADLLKTGLDNNAYDRAEGLQVELNLSSCYDFVEQFCVHILSNLADLDKQRECPVECREAASSLMFAAARFADLPELRELRSVFSEKYGKSLDCFANKEFVQRLKSMPPTKEMKIELLQDIASEIGIEWKAKALEQKQYSHPSKEGLAKIHDNDDTQPGKRMEPEYKQENVSDAALTPRKMKNGTKEGNNDQNILLREKSIPLETNGKSHLPEEGSNGVPPLKNHEVEKISIKHTHNGFDEHGKASEGELGKKCIYKSIPPPYTKPAAKSDDASPRFSNGKGQNHHDDATVEAKSKPKSVRRHHLKRPPGHEKGITEAEKRENSRGEELEECSKGSPRGRKDLHEEEEEKAIDKLLLHYSRKKLPHETGDSGSNDKPSPRKTTKATGKTQENVTRDRGPSRTTSLPVEPASPPTPTTKLHSRANSLQPEMLNANAHVHPKLPDYEDFIARLAALRES